MPDTIAAIATASAAAAVGIVRLSGAETRRVLAALFTRWTVVRPRSFRRGA